MKIVLWMVVIVLVVLFGTFPLSILAKIFEYIGLALNWIAQGIDFFGWNGLM